MIGAFNTVYTALQGFLSRNFWFATFLPVALFALVHVMVAVGVLGPISIFGLSMSFSEKVDTAQLASAGPAIIIGLVVMAYAISPLMPRFRGLLDGSLLPSGLHDWLRDQRRLDANAELDKINAARDDLAVLQKMLEDYDAPNGEFRTAYSEALNRASAPLAQPLERAQQALEALRAATAADGLMGRLATEAQAALLEAFATNNPSRSDLVRVRGTTPVTPPESLICTRTGEAADLFEDLLSKAKREALYRYQILLTRIRVAGALENPRATLIGDARFVVERYALDVYDVDFDFLWPRLIAAMRTEKADDPNLVAIENARAQSDFAVLSLVLSASVPAIWLPVMLTHGGPAWLFLVIGAATPVALSFFYELVFESQLAFGDIVKSTIDRSRLVVFKMLGLPLPTSRGEERALWQRIRAAEQDSRRADLIYAPVKTP